MECARESYSNTLKYYHQVKKKGLLWELIEIETRTRCGLNRALKLAVTYTVQVRFCYCFYLYANVQLVSET